MTHRQRDRQTDATL